MNTVVRWMAPDLLAEPEPLPLAEDQALALDAAGLDVDAEPEPEPEPEPPLQLPTLEEIQAIQEHAEKEGFERGHADGLAQGQAEVRRLVAQIEGILDSFNRPLVRLENEAVAALGELAVRIAGALVGRAYQAEPELLAQLVHEAVDAVAGTHREVEVRLHPDDIAALAPLLELPAQQRLVPDHGLGRGDLRVHAEAVRIDGTLEARLRSALDTVVAQAGANT